MATLEDLSNLIIEGKIKKSVALAQQLVDEGVRPIDVINNGLMPGMTEVGIRFKNNDMYTPEVILSAKAMEAAAEVITPLMADGELVSHGIVVMGTVKGDLHDIGKNLVIMMLKSAGFTVIDAGTDVSAENFVRIARENGAQIIGMSALLTTTMLHMKDLVELLKEEGIRNEMRVIIGGAPISQDFADNITADGYAPDAVSTVQLCKKLLA